MFIFDKEFIVLDGWIIERGTGEVFPPMAGGISFGSGGGSSSGYSQLPSVLQAAITNQGGIGNTAYAGYQQNNANTQNAINQLLELGKTENYDYAFDYLENLLSNDITTDPNIEALGQEYLETANESLNKVYSNAQKTGQFYSSFASDFAQETSDKLAEDYAQAIAGEYIDYLGVQTDAISQLSGLLSSLGALQQAGLEGTQTYYNQLLSLIQALSGSSETEDTSSFGITYTG